VQQGEKRNGGAESAFVSLYEAELRLLHYRQFSDKRFGVYKCWLDLAWCLGFVSIIGFIYYSFLKKDPDKLRDFVCVLRILDELFSLVLKKCYFPKPEKIENLKRKRE
jgi:hypothetical protein